MIRVLLADDHDIVRKGIRSLLQEEPDIHIVAEAATAREALSTAGREPLDLVLLDISLPDRNGLDVLRELKTLQPQLGVLVLSIHPEEQYALPCLKAGANGYLCKDSSPSELVSAIRKVASGERYITPSVAERLADLIGRQSEYPPHLRLSARELSVMLLIAAGKSVKEAANELGLSVKTVSTYRARVLEKMGMRSNADLIRYAVRGGLVP